ncbi:hypothetical protein G6045_26470 [Streptomyces sp. YC504]|uniref:Uncharacterized protein n=1 Tax=Streptomyces mesophilus TaxID=1775132 RepID=A0A6G4XPP9_9ACTN|nr:hypothetical protein [Streptomyces mesophilus]NGO79172.1 hypothetical protein [Streptomyces mesophilus]
MGRRIRMSGALRAGTPTAGTPMAAAVLAGLLTVITVTACSSGADDARSPAKTPSASESSGKTALTWDFEHIVTDFSGEISDVAALAENDIWAVATDQRTLDDPVHLLHFDGKEWKREPVPEALGESSSPPKLEEIGDARIWLRPQGPPPSHIPPGQEPPHAGEGWAAWDGTSWTEVAVPPPVGVDSLEAAATDDIWALSGEESALHWDGTRWNTYRLPYTAADLTIAGPDDVWAVGRRATGPGTELDYGTYGQPAAMHWDGTSWKAVETPVVRFDEPLPPEASASLGQVFAMDDGEVRAYGTNTYNHGEVENEPAEGYIRWRRDGTKWVDQRPAPGQCELRTPLEQDDKGLFLDGNWYLTEAGDCVKIKRHRLPVDTGARKNSNQSLWLEEIHRVPGTDEWLGAGHVQVNQSGDPFGAPVVVRLTRGGQQ